MNETGRIEAFSDGVFAIAITLLILELKVPAVDSETLGIALLRQWPSYLAFLASFFTIGVMWINHHRLFTLIGAADDALIAINLLLLLGITWVPFPTALLAEHLHARVAALVYSTTFFAMSLVFQLLWSYAKRTHGIIRNDKREQAIHITRQYIWGPVFYLIAILLALVSGTAVLIWSALLAIYFALPPALFHKQR
ncbi:MAG TPA: TMEM175 family protein [Thermoanaerobaculia bacterium]|nr:TMEM175 family protein [Thermoanaerobaculia bacterium]